MYGKLTNGNLDIFNDKMLCYTVEEDGVKYYVTCVNPDEKNFNEAGYYKLCDNIEPDDVKSAEFVLVDNTIFKKSDVNEETSVQ